MKRRRKDMKYNEELDYWVVFWGDNRGYTVRFGDWFELHLEDSRKLPCRMDIGRNWYIIDGRNEANFIRKK